MLRYIGIEKCIHTKKIVSITDECILSVNRRALINHQRGVFTVYTMKCVKMINSAYYTHHYSICM